MGGLGYWGGKLYGFGAGIWEIDTKTAMTKPIMVKNAPGYFQGAAVRTNAPIEIH